MKIFTTAAFRAGTPEAIPTALSVLHRRYYTKTKLALSILTHSASLSLPIFMLVLHGWIKVRIGE